MARQDVTVNLPIGDPDGTLKLLGKILSRNTAMGTDSPIKNDFSFADIAAGHLQITKLRADANGADREAQKKHDKALNLLGIALGQNEKSPGTIYTETLRIRKILEVKHRDNPEALEVWGFNVVVDQTGGKRTVRIDIPSSSPADFITLANAIKDKNINEGANSPLIDKIDMDAYKTRLTEAETLFNKAAELRADKETWHGQALNMLGYAPGQTSETEGTVYYLICSIRDLLLAVYSDNPEALSQWGFDVVVTESTNTPDDTPPVP